MILSELERDDLMAYQCIKKRYERYVLSVCYKIFRDEELMEGVFHEAVAILFQNIRKGDFRRDSGVGTYLTAIARNVYSKKIRTHKNQTYSLEDVTTTAEEENYVDDSISELIKRYADVECIKILTNRWVYKRKYADLVKDMTLNKSDTPEKALERVKKQFQRCRDKLKAVIKNNSFKDE